MMRFMQVAVLVLSMATLRAQDSAASGAPPFSNQTSGAASPAQDPSPMTQRTEALYQQRLQELEVNVARMHTLLDDMKAKLAAGLSKNAAAEKDNIALWEIMLGHLDRTLAQARIATMQRGALNRSANKNRASMVYRQPQTGRPAPGASTPSQPQTGPH